ALRAVAPAEHVAVVEPRASEPVPERDLGDVLHVGAVGALDLRRLRGAVVAGLAVGVVAPAEHARLAAAGDDRARVPIAERDGADDAGEPRDRPRAPRLAERRGVEADLAAIVAAPAGEAPVVERGACVAEADVEPDRERIGPAAASAATLSAPAVTG